MKITEMIARINETITEISENDAKVLHPSTDAD
jgi:hypothetical protein